MIYTNGQKKGYAVYISNYSIVNLNTPFVWNKSNAGCIKT